MTLSRLRVSSFYTMPSREASSKACSPHKLNPISPFILLIFHSPQFNPPTIFSPLVDISN